MSDWPDVGVDLVQAVADTKLVLSHRYAEWMLSGPVLEDDIAGASAAQDELGHVRQLYRLLEGQGRDGDPVERDPADVGNAATLDDAAADWATFVATMDVTDRAAWYLLDAVDHPDFDGLVERIGQDEYFHLEHLDGRVETLAADRPADLQRAFESVLPDALAFLGPASHAGDDDPLVGAGFTDRPVAEIRTAYREQYEDLLAGSDVSLDGVDWDAPAEAEWDPVRRRVGEGHVDPAVLEQLRGDANREFAIE